MQLRTCRFFLIQYVPERARKEAVNIGVLLKETSPAEGDEGELIVRFTRDWSRVRCIDPEAHIELLESLESGMRQLQQERLEGVKPLLEQFLSSLSNNLQLTSSNAYLVENLPAGMDKLMEIYVDRRKREAVSRKGGRAAIYGEMQTHFERAGVWELMRKRIRASQYSLPGDPLRIDCGYRPNGVVRMFQAVSLQGDVDAAKVLAFSLQGLREGVKREERAELEMTAIVEPLGAWEQPGGRAAKKIDPNGDREALYRFGVETMERASVRVMTTGDLPRIAETAQRELGV